MGRKIQVANSRAHEVDTNVVAAHRIHSSPQRAIRKKTDPVANRSRGVEFRVAENDVDVVGAPITVPPYQQEPLDVFSHPGHVAHFPFNTISPALLSLNPTLTKPVSKHLNPNIKQGSISRQSTPAKKRPHEDSDNEPAAASPTKRQRERVNEIASRAKRSHSERALSEARAALPIEYRAYVEKEVSEEFGPRTKEIDGENSMLDAKMFIADVMARSAISLRHLSLILKHNPDALLRSIAMEAMNGNTQDSKAGLIDNSTCNLPPSPLTGQGTEELTQDFALFEPFLSDWQAQFRSAFPDISTLI